MVVMIDDAEPFDSTLVQCLGALEQLAQLGVYLVPVRLIHATPDAMAAGGLVDPETAADLHRVGYVMIPASKMQER